MTVGVLRAGTYPNGITVLRDIPMRPWRISSNDFDRTTILPETMVWALPALIGGKMIDPSEVARIMALKAIFELRNKLSRKKQEPLDFVIKHGAKIVAGKNAPTLEAFTDTNKDDIFKPVLFRQAVDSIAADRADGRLPCIDSASPQEAIVAMGGHELLDVDVVIATRARRKGLTFDGTVEFAAYGKNKVLSYATLGQLLAGREITDGSQVDPTDFGNIVTEDSHVTTDSPSDVPKVDAFPGAQVTIRQPKDGLDVIAAQAIADGKPWKIELPKIDLQVMDLVKAKTTAQAYDALVHRRGEEAMDIVNRWIARTPSGRALLEANRKPLAQIGLTPASPGELALTTMADSVLYP